MWLLHTASGRLVWFVDPPKDGYIILSHVWTGEEQTFQEIKSLEHTGGLECASAKIRDCCAFARDRGFEWVWIDTCCIDKTSSAELSEAINSMFLWYRESSECVAFLHDVDADENPFAVNSQFRRSKWHTRGWTLQELIAPQYLVFVSKEWHIIGTKATLSDLVEDITNVGRDILTGEAPLDSVSVARRMSWAAKRQTTRIEDRAYSLLGIFGVNIPTVYGEGGRAFIRLQEEIIKLIPDQSLFVWGPISRNIVAHEWGHSSEWQRRGLLAESPEPFIYSSNVRPLPREVLSRHLRTRVTPPRCSLTSDGVSLQLPLLLLSCGGGWWTRRYVFLAVLACTDASQQSTSPSASHDGETIIALVLRVITATPTPLLNIGLPIQASHQAIWATVTISRRASWFPSRGYPLYPALLTRWRMSGNFVFPWAPLWSSFSPFRSPYAQMQDINFLVTSPKPLIPKALHLQWVVAPCRVVLLTWVAEEFERGGLAQRIYDSDVKINSFQIERGDRTRQEICYLYYNKAESSLGGWMIVISFWPCPRHTGPHHLHASATMRSPEDYFSDSPSVRGDWEEESCSTQHVSGWIGHAKEFALAPTQQTLRLAFDTLCMGKDPSGVIGNLYSLNVQLSSTLQGTERSRTLNTLGGKGLILEAYKYNREPSQGDSDTDDDDGPFQLLRYSFASSR